jgi:hypothetical protein
MAPGAIYGPTSAPYPGVRNPWGGRAPSQESAPLRRGWPGAAAPGQPFSRPAELTTAVMSPPAPRMPAFSRARSGRQAKSGGGGGGTRRPCRTLLPGRGGPGGAGGGGEEDRGRLNGEFSCRAGRIDVEPQEAVMPARSTGTTRSARFGLNSTPDPFSCPSRQELCNRFRADPARNHDN